MFCDPMNKPCFSSSLFTRLAIELSFNIEDLLLFALFFHCLVVLYVIPPDGVSVDLSSESRFDSWESAEKSSTVCTQRYTLGFLQPARRRFDSSSSFISLPPFRGLLNCVLLNASACLSRSSLVLITYSIHLQNFPVFLSFYRNT